MLNCLAFIALWCALAASDNHDREAIAFWIVIALVAFIAERLIDAFEARSK